MPIYEYRCESCDAVIEKLQHFSDPPLTKCEKCGGALVRLVSPPAFKFKGSGWYVTDYARSGSGGNGGGKNSGEPAKTPKKTEKPASKGDAATAKKSS